VQILLQLKGAGLVASTRGAAGGYQLNKPPEDISLGEVMGVIEGPENDLTSTNASTNSPTSRVLTDAWQEIAQLQREMLSSLTFGELVRRVKRTAENMYYI
jgi:Rrf2 family cysteine metabolism transcriptional repressor